jgi:RNA recognition motif-containing protein
MIRINLDFMQPKLETINFSMIKIGNIPWEISTRDVVELIEPFLWKGKANQDWIHIPIDRVTGKTLSDLFVEVPTIYEAQVICSNLDKHILKQRALNVTMSDYDELLAVLIKPEAVLSKCFITSDEVESLLDICTNYKVNQSEIIYGLIYFRFIFLGNAPKDPLSTFLVYFE